MPTEENKNQREENKAKPFKPDPFSQERKELQKQKEDDYQNQHSSIEEKERADEPAPIPPANTPKPPSK